MNFQNQLEDEYSRLQKLKANIHIEAIKEFILEEQKRWHPKIKEIEGPVFRGQDGANSEFHTYYWDEYNLEWTTLKFAFKGHLFKLISNLINKRNNDLNL